MIGGDKITLDDAIELMENQCNEFGLVLGVFLYSDEITDFLKEYRDKKKQLDIQIAENKRAFEQFGIEVNRYQEAVKNCEVAENKYKRLYEETSQNLCQTSQNEPLTWDELAAMDGKPVWIEIIHKDIIPLESSWGIATEPFKGYGGQLLFRLVCSKTDYLLQAATYWTCWKAYRKER